MPSELVSCLGQHLLVVLPRYRKHGFGLDAVILRALAVEGVWPRSIVSQRRHLQIASWLDPLLLLKARRLA